MAELDNRKPVSLEELMLANLAQTDALTKPLLEKGIISDAEAEASETACGPTAHSKSNDK
jgi:hypothetical protein